MNTFKIFFGLIISIGFCTCHGVKNTSIKPDEEKNEVENRNSDCSIKNRIPNCDSTFVFMDHLIVPLKTEKAKLENLYPKERSTTIVIPGESQDFYKNKKHNYYINTDCLIGRKSADVIRMMCTENMSDSYMKMDRMFQKDKSSWIMVVNANNNFKITIHFEDGEVTRATVYGGISESH